MVKKVEDYLLERLTTDFIKANVSKKRVAVAHLDEKLIVIADLLSSYPHHYRAHILDRLNRLQEASTPI